MRNVLCVAFLLASGSAAAAPTLWAGNNHYYELFTTGTTWTGALAAAAGAGPAPMPGYSAPHLVTLTSAAENGWVSNTLAPGVGFWAAGTDQATEGVWVWAAGPEAGQVFWNGGPGGSSPTYANWNAGEPNNQGNEDYLIGNWSADRWNDLPDFVTYSYVVEWSLLPVETPAPATGLLLIGGLAAMGAARRRRG
jgi:hypothetical protein